MIVVWMLLIVAMLFTAGVTETMIPGLFLARTGTHRAAGPPSVLGSPEQRAERRADRELRRQQRAIDRLAAGVERERRRNAEALSG